MREREDGEGHEWTECMIRHVRALLGGAAVHLWTGGVLHPFTFNFTHSYDELEMGLMKASLSNTFVCVCLFWSASAE